MVPFLDDGVNRICVRALTMLIAPSQIEVRWTFIVGANVGEKGVNLFVTVSWSRDRLSLIMIRVERPTMTRDHLSRVPPSRCFHPVLLAFTAPFQSTIPLRLTIT